MDLALTAHLGCESATTAQLRIGTSDIGNYTLREVGISENSGGACFRAYTILYSGGVMKLHVVEPNNKSIRVGQFAGMNSARQICLMSPPDRFRRPGRSAEIRTIR